MVFEKVKAIIAKELGVDASTITLETRLAEDLGAVELIMAIEDEFGVQVDDENAQNIRKVGDIVSYLEK